MIDLDEPVTATVRLGSDELTPAEVARLARTPEVGLSLPAMSRDRMERSVRTRDQLLATGRPLYGVTTGFGDSAVNQLSADQAAALQRALIRYHLVGSGPTAPDDVVRATMIIRANCLARGYSGVRPAVVQALLDLLAHDIVPIVPERGSVGASGDLVPLCYLADALTGAGDVRHRGIRCTAADALAGCGLGPLSLEPKEALGLINGTSFMSGFAVLTAADAAELAVVAEACTALAVEVLGGNRGAFAPLVHAQKPHPGQIRSAATIGALLTGSALARNPDEIEAANRAIGSVRHRRLDHPIQDRYSLRCAPQVIGVLRDTGRWVDEWLRIEINSTNDNPLFDPDAVAVHNGGNFYGGHVGLAMDSLKVAVASVGDLLDRQIALMVDEKFNNGLPANLVAPGSIAGLNHGFKGAQIAASALVAEALKLGMPATAFSRSTEAHNQDKVSMGTIAARDARTAVELVTEVAALQLAAACQAADLRGPEQLGVASRAVYDLVRRHVAFLDEDRRLDRELAGLVTALRDGALSRALNGSASTAGTMR
jgi:histidine ammonia-lyase/phenylalanine ammonia-lyase